MKKRILAVVLGAVMVMSLAGAAVQTCSPACKPTIGGKIMLPAPTNNANVIKPRAMISRDLN